MTKQWENSCPANDDLLAYLYDDLSSAGRDNFESHLEGCSACIDEFAELSHSRYSVYEWNRLEFAELSTPQIRIPYDLKAGRTSWMGSLKSIFASGRRVAFAGGLCALLAVVIGTVLLAGPDWSSQPSLVAGVEPVGIAEIGTIESEPKVDRLATENREVDTVPRSVTAKAGSPRKKSTNGNRSVAKPAPVRTVASSTVRLQNSPTLSQYVDERDNSLRLSDIFDAVEDKDLEE